ncbi:MAG: hypothetical protein IJX93_02025 [Clostridia bacterium]|nr:hypothetical protein [Clostridia bacterium]
MRFTILMLVLLMLAGCADTADPKAEDAVPAETVEAQTETAETEEEITSEEAEKCLYKAVEMAADANYVITSDAVWKSVRLGDITEEYPFQEKLLTKLLDSDLSPDSAVILVTIPTETGECHAIYTRWGLLLTERPQTIPQPVESVVMPDHSLPAEAPDHPAQVHGITQYHFTPKSDDYRGRHLIRITSRDELDTVLGCFEQICWLDGQYTLDVYDGYDSTWFETHDLYIADTGMGSSFPDLEVMEVVEGNALRLVYQDSDIATADIIGRHVVVEVDKGDVITWVGSEGRYHTAETYAAQISEWLVSE